MEKLEKIASFTVDHNLITEGVYVSRTDGDIVTYDLRFCRPNLGVYLTNLEMHSVEHLFATYVRSGPLASQVIYFGPMGCQTGFYLLLRGVDNDTAYREIVSVLEKITRHTGDMPGASAVECGNYKNLSTDAAKEACKRYLAALAIAKNRFDYPTEREE